MLECFDLMNALLFPQFCVNFSTNEWSVLYETHKKTMLVSLNGQRNGRVTVVLNSLQQTTACTLSCSFDFSSVSIIVMVTQVDV